MPNLKNNQISVLFLSLLSLFFLASWLAPSLNAQTTPTPTLLPDTVAPRAATASASYNATTHKIDFRWYWTGDNTCAGCWRAGYCQSADDVGCQSSSSQTPNKSNQGICCNNTVNPPFWWQVVNETDGEVREAYSYNNQSSNQKNTSGNASNANSYSISCTGRERDTLRIDVRTRDAVGNIRPELVSPHVQSAKATCPSVTPTVSPTPGAGTGTGTPTRTQTATPSPSPSAPPPTLPPDCNCTITNSRCSSSCLDRTGASLSNFVCEAVTNCHNNFSRTKGDATGDGKTCLTDYSLMQSAFNGLYNNNATTKLRADFNGNGLVDDGDSTIFRANYDPDSCGQSF